MTPLSFPIEICGAVNVFAETTPPPLPTFTDVLADNMLTTVDTPLTTTFPWNVAFLSFPKRVKASCGTPLVFLVTNLNPTVVFKSLLPP